MNEPAFTSVTAKSLLIWLSTNLIAAVSYGVLILTLEGIDASFAIVGTIIVLGLAFSFPANLFLAPALYLLSMLRSKWYRLAYSIGIVLFLSLMVILCFFQYFNVSNTERPDLIVFLLPYIIGAEISFIVVARKMIFGDLSGMPRMGRKQPEKFIP